MAPTQTVSNPNTLNSPKKSKKRNKKNRHSTEKEVEVKVVNEQEKEVCVENIVVPETKLVDTKQPLPRQPCSAKQSPPKEVCPVKQTPPRDDCQSKQSPPKEICPSKQTQLNKICQSKQSPPKELCPAQQSPEEIVPAKPSPTCKLDSFKPTSVQDNSKYIQSPGGEVCPTKLTKNNKENYDKKGKKETVDVDVFDQKLQDFESEQKDGVTKNSLASEVAKARQLIKNSLQCMDSVAALAGTPNVEVMNKINSLEKENQDLKKTVEELRKSLQSLKIDFESFSAKFAGTPVSKSDVKPAQKPAAAPAKDDSDDGVDLFGSDDEEESAEAAKIREERLAAYNAKKSKKPTLIAKSNIILDVKPWDDETDMKAMEAAVRTVSTDGLLWGAAKLVPLAYGIHKLQISCVVEDDKVSIDWLTEELEKIEDYVQSVDIAAFNKV